MIITGIITALISGLMLGLYALPGKFTKDFKEENTWGLFFMLTMFVVPLLASLTLMKGIGDVYSDPDVKGILPVMIVSAIAWGIGVMMWGKAIHHIGLSLGFSLFIGTVIFIGSVLPLGINLAKGEALPDAVVLALVAVGILVVLAGIVFNGKAGLAREADSSKDEEGSEEGGKKSMATGILIAVVGGLLATGFNVAFTVAGGANTQGALGEDGKPIGIMLNAVTAAGNPGWMVSLGVMLIVFLSGGVIMAGYFGWQITSKKAWGSFKTPSFTMNFILIFIMAFFHYAASVGYGYGASLFPLGPVVVYAIFNTTCVVTAVVSGIVTKEWVEASDRAKKSLYMGLACMVAGVGILTASQAIQANAGSDAASEEAEQAALIINE